MKARTKRHTLKDIRKLAVKDPAFLNSLLKNPKEALERRKLNVSEADLRRIKAMVRGSFTVKGKDLLQMFSDVHTHHDPGIRPWPIGFKKKLK